MKSYTEQMIALKDAYEADGQECPATARMIAAWAVRTKAWDQQSKQKVDACARDLSAALKTEMHTDPQGHRVRANCSFMKIVIDDDGKKKQKWFWGDVRTTPHDEVLSSFRSRWKGNRAADDALDRDIDSYNQNWLPFDCDPITMGSSLDTPEDGDGDTREEATARHTK